VVCRAFRTEKAEQEAGKLRKALEGAEAEIRDSKARVAFLEDRMLKLYDQVTDLEKARTILSKAHVETSAALEKAKQAHLDSERERGELKKHYDAALKQNAEYRAALDVAERKVAVATKAAQSILEN
jgi:chromosome segregation ATPase